MRKTRLNAIVGGALIGLLLAVAATSLVWTPYDPLQVDFLSRLKAPSASHWMGTDEFGRDILSRVMAAAGTSVGISLMSVGTALVVGGTIGLAAGYFRGWIDRALMMVNDALLAFPSVLLALTLLTIVGANRTGIVLALGLSYTPSVARVLRGTVISVATREFVDAAMLMGNSRTYTILRHILPNCLAPMIVLATSMFGWALLSESALSFLGLGVPPPAPTWGNMLSSSRSHFVQAGWLAVFPGLCITLTLLGINLLGDALRDRLDPRMRGV